MLVRLLVVVALTLLAVPLAPQQAHAVTISGVPTWNQNSLNTAALRASGCAATSLAMICNYYGSGKGLQTTVDLFIANGICNTSGWILKYTGLAAAVGGTAVQTARVSPADLTRLRQEIDAGRPVQAWDDSLPHHYVIVGYSGSTFYINDPGTGTYKTNPYRIDGYFTYSGTPAGVTIPANIKVPGYAGFAKYGTPEGWRAIGGGLYGTGLWTYSGSGTRDNYARWTFDLSKINGARKYKAEAYVTSTHAGTTSADYHINTAGGLVHKSVNQLVLSNQWANLGSYSFALGSARVELDDVTAKAGEEIAFDAIRLTPYFNLKYIAGTGGTVAGTTTQSILSGGSGTAVTAKPNTGFRFVKWSDGSTAATRTDSNVRADKTLTASFEALGLTVTKIAGADRITTAIEASKKAFPSGATTVVIATAFNWPDALGGSALAGAMRGPILLVAPDSLSPAVAAEIDHLNATKAIVLGGTGAVSNDVYVALDALGGVSVERIAGANRYETGEKIAARTIAEMKTRSSYSGRAFVSTGQNFPDALGASPLASAKGWPIYLIDPAAGDNSALAARMKSVGVTNAVVLGGPAAVSTAVESRLKTTLGTASRIAGDNRYQTAVKVASYGVSSAGLSWNRVGVATGQDFPDALAGGVLQGVSGSVMVLTPSSSLDANVRTALVANKSSITEVRYLGGTGVVTTTVRAAVEQALQ